MFATQAGKCQRVLLVQASLDCWCCSGPWKLLSVFVGRVTKPLPTLCKEEINTSLVHRKTEPWTRRWLLYTHSIQTMSVLPGDLAQQKQTKAAGTEAPTSPLCAGHKGIIYIMFSPVSLPECPHHTWTWKLSRLSPHFKTCSPCCGAQSVWCRATGLISSNRKVAAKSLS